MFDLFAEGETPELKLPLNLRVNDSRPTPKHPSIVGYCVINQATLRAMTKLLADEETIMLRVALWDDSEEGRIPRNPEYPIGGAIEYREYEPPTSTSNTPPKKSIWY